MADHATCALELSTLSQKQIADATAPGESLDNPEDVARIVERAKTSAKSTNIKNKKTLEAEVRFNQVFIPNVEKMGAKRALSAMLVRDLRDEAGTVGIAQLSRGYQRRVGMLLDEVAETFKPTVTGGQRNVDILRDVVDMMNGKKQAKFEQSQRLFEAMREGERLMLGMYRQAGGEIRTLENWFPQTHNARLVDKAGMDGWKAKVTPLLDASKMLDKDGKQLSPEQLDELLNFIYERITTQGRGQVSIPSFVDSLFKDQFAARQSMERILHFESPQGWMEYHDAFGDGDLWGNFTNHLHQLSVDTAAMRTFGPDAAANFNKYAAFARQADPSLEWGDVQHLWDNILGFDTKNDHTATAIAHGARDIISSAWMGSAVLASVPDTMTSILNAAMNDLDIPRMLAGMNEFADPKSRARMAQAAGDIEWANSSMAQNLRFEENLGTGMARRMSDANYRLGGMNAWTDRWRHVHQREFLRKFAEESGNELDQTSAGFRGFLKTYGLDADWDTIRQAQTMDDGSGIMNLSAMTDNHLIAKVLGALDTERDLAMLTPDARVRAGMNLGTAPGTGAGEAIRSMGQFKTFPVTMAMHGIGRYILSGRLDGRTRAKYIASMVLGMTALGAVSYQLKEMSKGHDPVDMNSGDFWIKSLGYGGAMPGIFEIIIDGQTRHGRSALEAAAGPVGGLAGDLYRLSVGTGMDWIRDEDWKANMAKGVENMSRYTPGQSLWWGRAFAERTLRDALMEIADPNYANRQRQKQGYLKDRSGNEQFWEYDGSLGGDLRSPEMPAMPWD
jgi:hypothetical protein